MAIVLSFSHSDPCLGNYIFNEYVGVSPSTLPLLPHHTFMERRICAYMWAHMDVCVSLRSKSGISLGMLCDLIL